MGATTTCLAGMFLPLLAMGQFTDEADRIVFVPTPGDVMVIPRPTEVFRDSQKITTLAEGTLVMFHRQRGEKVYISFNQDGKTVKGWVDEEVLVAPRAPNYRENGEARSSGERNDPEKVLGYWHEVYRERNGREVKGKERMYFYFTREMIFEQKPSRARRNRRPREHQYQLDPASDPKQLDLISTAAGKVSIRPGIYKLKGDDTLIWCYHDSYAETEEDRPSDFTTSPGDLATLVVLKGFDPAQLARRRAQEQQDGAEFGGSGGFAPLGPPNALELEALNGK